MSRQGIFQEGPPPIPMSAQPLVLHFHQGSTNYMNFGVPASSRYEPYSNGTLNQNSTQQQSHSQHRDRATERAQATQALNMRRRNLRQQRIRREYQRYQQRRRLERGNLRQQASDSSPQENHESSSPTQIHREIDVIVLSDSDNENGSNSRQDQHEVSTVEAREEHQTSEEDQVAPSNEIIVIDDSDDGTDSNQAEGAGSQETTRTNGGDVGREEDRISQVEPPVQVSDQEVVSEQMDTSEARAPSAAPPAVAPPPVQQALPPQQQQASPPQQMPPVPPPQQQQAPPLQSQQQPPQGYPGGPPQAYPQPGQQPPQGQRYPPSPPPPRHDLNPYTLREPSKISRAHFDFLMSRRNQLLATPPQPRVRVINAYVSIFTTRMNHSQLLEYIKYHCRIRPQDWRIQKSLPSLIRSTETSSDTVKEMMFCVKVNNANDLPFNLQGWQTVFGSHNLKTSHLVMWHSLSTSELLRMIILATFIEAHPSKRAEINANYQIAVGDVTMIKSAWEDGVVRGRVRAVLLPDAIRRLETELTYIDRWSIRQ